MGFHEHGHVRVPFVLSLPVLVFPFTPSLRTAAQDAASAKSSLEGIYQHYRHGGPGIDMTGPEGESVLRYTSLLSLMRKDENAALPEIGVVDGDLICGCQDWDGIWDLKIAVQMQGDGRAVASVSFTLRDPREKSSQDLRSLDFTLSIDQEKWRIYDVLINGRRCPCTQARSKSRTPVCASA
jgi:hypothetical protein